MKLKWYQRFYLTEQEGFITRKRKIGNDIWGNTLVAYEIRSEDRSKHEGAMIDYPNSPLVGERVRIYVNRWQLVQNGSTKVGIRTNYLRPIIKIEAYR